jgi:hypothetical protein
LSGSASKRADLKMFAMVAGAIVLVVIVSGFSTVYVDMSLRYSEAENSRLKLCTGSA